MYDLDVANRRYQGRLLIYWHDALEELSDLSEALQKADITVYRATRLITKQIEVFVCRKNQGGSAYVSAENAVAEGCFKGVELAETIRANARSPINRAQFYQALADSMQARLLPTSEHDLVELVQTVLPGTWEAVLPPEYGELHLKTLCSKFCVPYSGELKTEYREYKDTKGCNIGTRMKRFVSAVDTLPVSTAACERGFSRMNLICTPQRTQLTIEHLSSLMFVAIEGPPITQFDPVSYVKLWLSLGRHAATDMGNAKKDKVIKIEPGTIALWKCL